MANTKSALKNARKAKARMLSNRQAKSRLKTLERQFNACLDGNDEKAARKASAEFISALDRAAKSSIIHRNKATRKKSSCSQKIARIGESPAPVEQEHVQEEPASESLEESTSEGLEES